MNIENALNFLKEYNRRRKGDGTGPYYFLITKDGKFRLVNFMVSELSYDDTLGKVTEWDKIEKTFESIIKSLNMAEKLKGKTNQYLFGEED